MTKYNISFMRSGDNFRHEVSGSIPLISTNLKSCSFNDYRISSFVTPAL